MEKTEKMLQMERDAGGKDIRQQIGDAYVKTGSRFGAARELKMNYPTLRAWIEQLDGEEQGEGLNRRLVFEGYRVFGAASEEPVG